MVAICTSPVSELKELKDIFIELTAKNCNQRCRQCYIDFPLTKNIKDFIKVDTVKKALLELKENNIRCIYLTGAEPMTHPDFNSILRLCLEKANVCIFTNASFINEKKARFLKKVEKELNKKIIFKLSFAHYDEIKNDNVRSRGAYRQNIYALKCLDKYDFTNIINVSNYYCEDHSVILSKFKEKLSSIGIEDAIVQINEWSKEADGEFLTIEGSFDCTTSRTLTENGIFSCPFLSNDYRGRTGSDFTNYSKTVRLETPHCISCINNKEPMFSVDIDW
ncbi:radical SAM protein [bacterium]|nr:radical SAM protein [bacterium]